MPKSFNLHVEELAMNYYLKSYIMNLEQRLSPLRVSVSSSDKENEDPAPHYHCSPHCYPYNHPSGLQFLEPPVPVVSRPRTDRDALIMSAAKVTESKEWCLVEWANGTCTIVKASEVSDLKNQETGSSVFVKSGDEQVLATLVGRSFNREALVKESKEKNKILADPPVEDYREPSDFEPSATDWVPSDENPSDSEFEVENKKRKLSVPKTTCKKRQSAPAKNVLTPSNKVNTVARRKKNRKQVAPKQFISPPKEEPIFVPLPKKIISPTGKTIHILPNSTRPPPNKNAKQGPPKSKRASGHCRYNKKNQVVAKGKKSVASNDTKPISLDGINNNQRKRTYQATRRYTSKENYNTAKTNTPKPKANTLKQNANDAKANTPKQYANAAKTITPKQIVNTAKEIKPEENVTKETGEEIISKDKPVTNNNIPNKQNKEPEDKTQGKEEPVTETAVNNGKYPLKIDKSHNFPEIDQPDQITVIMDVQKYTNFRQSVSKVYKIYHKAIKVLSKRKRKEHGLKRLQTFYKAHRVVTDEKKDNQKVIVNATNQDIVNGTNQDIVNGTNQDIVNATNCEAAEDYSDENLGNDNLDDFDRSDDNILISNKFQNIETADEPEHKTSTEKLVAIGSGKTLIPKDKFRKIKWNSYTVATRGLLLAAFPRRVLATHSMTGKRSPAFLHKPAKMCLDPKKVSDIIIEVMDRFKIRENLIRSVITTKCADEAKMFRMRMQKKEREAKAQSNNKKNPTVAA